MKSKGKLDVYINLWGDFLIVLFSLFFFSFLITENKYLAIIPLVIFLFHSLKKLGAYSLMEIAGLIGMRTEKHLALFIIVSILSGFGLGVFYRSYVQTEIFPSAFSTFVFTATLIGLSEEVVFRGYLMWVLRRHKYYIIIVLTAFTHASYKIALFLNTTDNNLFMLGFITFIVGLFLGCLKIRSQSIWPCIFFHVVFDIIVYGDGVTPWWVW
ncbi:CPBP family intramembrane glutamic endopeptidase [uncultured Roseivirga sp.]|uniref:CPBP family intramembrane glutamic endopeptidase n=1 Tax=uncultured Roseivirga sp. TaxID=543088 RepID=UPI0030DC05C2